MTEQSLNIVQDKPVQVSNASTMLQAVGQLAMNPDVDIDKLERIMQMQVGLQERENEAAFNRVMSTVQSQTETIKKNRQNKQTSSSYADLSAVIQMVKPVYSEAGMALSFDTENTDDKEVVRVVCMVSAEGYTRRYTYDSPLTDKGIAGKTMMTPAHARGSAISYGRRYLTCMIFNIDTSDDTDGNGGNVTYITDDQAIQITDLLAETKSDTVRFLKWLKASSVSHINAGQYDMIIKTLEKKRK